MAAAVSVADSCGTVISPAASPARRPNPHSRSAA